METAYAPPGYQPPPNRSRSPWVWVGLGGCGCALVATVLLGGLGYTAYHAVRRAMATGDAAARPFLYAIDRGDDKAAYAMTGPEFREIQPYADFREYVDHWRNLEGGLGRLDCVWVGENATPQGRFLNVRFHSSGASRNADIQVSLRRMGSDWRVTACNYTLQARKSPLKR